MNLVNKYLRNLAENNRRVIIPELGAFLLKDGAGAKKSIIFSSFLRYNDGFLEESIVREAQIDKAQATTLIRKFVEEVERVTRSKKRYDIEGWGYFFTDDKGALQFAIIEDNSIVVEVPSDKEIENKINSEKKEDLVTPPQEKVVVVPPVAPQPARVEPVTPPVQVKIEENRRNERNTDQTPPLANPSMEEAYIYAKKRSRLLWVIIFLLIVIIFQLVLLYLCVNNSDLCFFRKKTTQTELLNQGQGNSINNGIVNQSATPPLEPSLQELGYHIIAGCFYEKINAERFVQWAISQGYSATVMLPKMGDWIPVSIGKSVSFEEAERLRAAYNAKYNGDAWIYPPK